MTTTAQHFAEVIRCDHCARQGFPKLLRDDEFDLPQPGYVGSNYANTRVLLVSQNPGVSPDRFNAQDKDYAAALIAVRDNPTAAAYNDLKAVLDRIIPTWPYFKNYFPLAECGLGLDDIAFFDTVRCRTVGNATPGRRLARACIGNHFARWLDWLQPRVVVFTVKWAHDNTAHLLNHRGIPNGFINRRRSLSNIERQANRAEVAALVRGVLHGEQQSAPRAVRAAPPPKPAPSSTAQVATRKSGGAAMTKDEYIDLFKALGFYSIELRKTLKHTTPIPSLYFNHIDGQVSFVGRAREEQMFPGRLWDRLPPQQKKDNVPRLITIVPKHGKEREAFVELLGG